MRRAVSTAVAVAVAAGFYLLLIDTTDLPELYVLGGVAILCGAAFYVTHREHVTLSTVGEKIVQVSSELPGGLKAHRDLKSGN